MNTIDTLLADPLSAVRGAAHPVGFVGLDIPLEVLTGNGRVACHLPWDRAVPTPRADRWLESGFGPWTRRILEDWAEGRFDLFEHVVFTRGDDNAQRLYYYVCELQRRGEIKGPKPLIFDVAYVRRATSVERTRKAVADLSAHLGVAAADLAIVQVNTRRAALAALQASRQADGPLYERLARASLFGDVTATPPSSTAKHRLLLAGTPPPDGRLHQAVEDAGASIIAETHERSLSWLGQHVAEDGEPLRAVADSIYARTTGARTFSDRGQRLVAAARDAQADAVLLWLIEEEESEVWHVPAQRAALAAAGIPALVLTRRAWLDDISGELTHFLKERAA
jgi:hypothetical protein